MELVRLNIGGGDKPLDGFVTVDIKKGVDAAVLPYADGSVEEIYASHVLEHFPHQKTRDVLKEWLRVLRPGGKISISVPDVDRLLEERRTDPRFSDQLFQHCLLGGEIDEHDRHGAVYYRERLVEYLMALGVEAIEDFEPRTVDCSAYRFSLNLCGVKRPPFAIKSKPHIVMVLSESRLAFGDTRDDLQEIVRVLGAKYGLELVPRRGQSWDQSLENGIQAAIAKYDPDYILTIDFDGAFKPDDLERLVEIMQRRTDLAALFPMQMSRHDAFPLLFRPGFDYSGEITEVPFAHFGLTLLRTQCLKSLPKPWFWAIPSAETEDFAHPMHSDTDITFWRTMGAHGFKVAQANRVILGHIELAVRWPGQNGLMFQPIADYRQKGKPKNVCFDAAPFLNKLLGERVQGKALVEWPIRPEPGFESLVRHRRGWHFGEAGILEELHRRLERHAPFVVEIGGGDGQDIPTTLQDIAGATGVVYEADPVRAERLQKFIYPRANVLGKFVPGEDLPEDEIDILIVDVDGHELHLLGLTDPPARAWIARKPSLVMVEHHDLCDVSRWTLPDCPPEDMLGKTISGFCLQHTQSAVVKFMEAAGYQLVCTTRINSIFVHKTQVARAYDRPLALVGAADGGVAVGDSVDIRDAGPGVHHPDGEGVRGPDELRADPDRRPVVGLTCGNANGRGGQGRVHAAS